MSSYTKCPCSEKYLAMIEYDYNSPEHYDGISEYYCGRCKKRVGRWSGRVLEDGELEKKLGKK